jgi:hypothetical protein
MKNLKLILMALAFPFLFSCEKERFIGQYGNYDLNNDSEKEIVFRTPIKGKSVFYYFNDYQDTVYIARFSKRPFLLTFYDIEGDGYPDAVYSEISGDKTKTFILNNEAGIFSKEAEEMK